jgi:hypothetical protein
LRVGCVISLGYSARQMTEERSRSEDMQPLDQPLDGDRLPYEPPVLVALGNVRDILAGGGGNYFDVDSGFEDLPGGA